MLTQSTVHDDPHYLQDFLLADRKIVRAVRLDRVHIRLTPLHRGLLYQAKAHHPAMLAYRCKGINGVVHQDNDDDVSLICHPIGTSA